MSLEASRQNISEPNYYHREYKNDIGEESKGPSWGQQCQRVATVALPFFSLYKPLSLPISLGMGALRTFSCVNQLFASIKQGDSKDIPYQLLQTTIAVMALAGTIFAHPAGMLITTAHDLIIETVHLAGHLQRGEYREALLSCANIINNALYLALFTHGGIELAVASFAIQAMIGLYHSHGEYLKGKYLEATGHLLMATIRGNQMSGQVQLLQTKWKFEDVMEQVRHMQSRKVAPEESPPNTQSKVLMLSENIKSILKSSSSSIVGDAVNGDARNIVNHANSEFDQELINILIKYGNNTDGIPALHYAVSQCDENAVRLLLQHGASPNALARQITCWGDTNWGDQLHHPIRPLEYAAKNGDVKIMALLLEYGAHVNVSVQTEDRSYRWSPALNFASKFDKENAVNLLISRGSIVNPSSDIPEMFPIYLATKNGSVRALDVLVKSGADVKTLCGGYESLLHVAAEANQPKSIRYLATHGINVDTKNPHTGNTALHDAIIYKQMESAEELLRNKANIDALNNSKLTPLMCIFEYQHAWLDGKNGLQRVKLLVDNGAGMEFRDGQGRTAFRRLMERYIWNTYDFNNDGEFKDIVLYLAKKGVDINARDDANHTLLFYARQAKRQEVIRWLLEHRATE